MTAVELIDDPDALAPYLEDWDRLALAARQPYSAPGWMLAWWRHAAPAGSRLAVVILRDHGTTIAIAPMFLRRSRTGLEVARLLGTGHRVEPLVRRGSEEVASAAIVEALRSLPAPPGALSLDRGGTLSRWPSLLAAAWPRGATTIWSELTGAPTVTLEGRRYEEWLEGRSPNFRSQHARARRRLDREGARFRLVGRDDDVTAAIDAFIDLTVDRWVPRLGTERGPEGIRAMLLEAASTLVPAGRMRIWTLEIGGSTVSVQIFLVADGEVAYWNGGYSKRYSRLRPGFETILRAIEHAFAEGDRRLDLGGGDAAYKRRLADDDDPIRSVLLLPAGRARIRRRAQLAPQVLARRVRRTARRTPPAMQRRLRSVRALLP